MIMIEKTLKLNILIFIINIGINVEENGTQ